MAGANVLDFLSQALGRPITASDLGAVLDTARNFKFAALEGAQVKSTPLAGLNKILV